MRHEGDQILWRATAAMRDRANGPGDGQGTEPGVTGRVGPAASRNRIAQRTHRGIRRAHRANRQGNLSSGGCAQTGERGKTKKNRLDSDRPSRGRQKRKLTLQSRLPTQLCGTPESRFRVWVGAAEESHGFWLPWITQVSVAPSSENWSEIPVTGF